MTDKTDPADCARRLLTDAFGRVHELVPGVVEGPQELLRFRIDPAANTVAWLVWHTARQQDAQVAQLAGVDQAWTAGGWLDRFRTGAATGLGTDDTGYGDSTDDVGRLDQATADTLIGYHEAVHSLTAAYLGRLDTDELDRVIDDSDEPPVTVVGRLVSVVADALQHLGQAAYVRGLADRAGSSAGSSTGSSAGSES